MLTCLAVFVLTLAVGSAAQENAPAVDDAGTAIAAEVAAMRSTLEGRDGLTDELRSELLASLDQAAAQLQAAAGWRDAVAATAREVEAGPGELAQLEADRQNPSIAAAEVAADVTASEFAPLVADIEAALRAKQLEVEALERELNLFEERRTSLPEVLTAARSQLAEVDARLAQQAPVEGPTELDEVQRLLARARRTALVAEIEAYETERAGSEVRDELLGARLRAATRRRAALEERVEIWRARLAALRRDEAEAAAVTAAEAARLAAQSHPAVEQLATRNAEIALQRTGPEGLVARIAGLSRQLDETRKQASDLAARHTRVRQRSEAAGGSQSVGFLLVEERSRLPEVASLQRELESREEVTSKAQLERFDAKDASAELIDVEASVEKVMESLRPPIVDAGQRAVVRDLVREQYERRREYLDELSSDYREYLRLASDLELAERDLIAKTEAFAHFIDERVLWVRIASPIYEDIGELWPRLHDDLEWLVNVSAWVEFGRALSEAFKRDGLLIAVRTILLIAFLALRPALRRRIEAIAELVRRLRTDQFGHTVHVFGLTALVALGVPLFLWFFAHLLRGAALGMNDGGEVVRAAAGGFEGVSRALFVAGFVVRACRTQGLAEVHFRWPPPALKSMRRNLRWFLALALPCQFVASAMIARYGTGFGDALGRCAFIAGQLVIAIFAYRVLHPERGVISSLLDELPNGWLSRLRALWFPLAVGLPVTLIFLAVLGYTYSALQLTLRMQDTLMLILSVVFGRALLMRWLHVARRRLAVQQYLKRRGRTDSGELSDVEGEETEVDEIDVESVSEQSRRLVQFAVSIAFLAGLWIVWSEVLPALTSEDVDVALWETSRQQTTVVNNPDGSVDRLTESFSDFVTLGDVLLAIAILVITFVAGSNLPGLLEIAVLQKLPFQAAGRYAITTISRYLILIIGIITAFGAVDIGWGKVQWLAAAVTVGLGFGLQEVFSNFVSGLILLFERPMRVGDTVTVGDVTGAVTRIRMRATTIVTWDRTELIVPNREFITTQVVNWTLSDSVLRVIVRVGIAYGSNIDRAEKVLYKIARENTNVLSDPGPRVVFAAFGDSTLDFELRFFVASPEMYRTIHHQLNRAIDGEFRAAGIEIAFPQRDLHLRTADVPLAIVRREDPDATGVDASALAESALPAPGDEEDPPVSS